MIVLTPLAIFKCAESYPPIWRPQTATATIVATAAATTATDGASLPSMAALVKEANNPPAGVNAPYAQDWKAAATVPDVRTWLVSWVADKVGSWIM